MYFPEENYSHFKQEKFSFESNCESKPKISLNKRIFLRQIITHNQMNELKQIFDKNKNQLPSIYVRKELAKKMGVSQMKISMWFNSKIRMWKRTSESDCKSESKRREYKKFKSYELIELEQIFEKNHYPDKNIRNDLAQKMGVSNMRIQRWFICKRRRLKKHVPSSTNAGGDYVDFTSSTGDVNYPPTPFYSRAEIMPDHPYRHPHLHSRPDFSAAFSAEQYSSHHVPLTDQWTNSDTQLFSTVGFPTYCSPATVTYPQSVLTSL